MGSLLLQSQAAVASVSSHRSLRLPSVDMASVDRHHHKQPQLQRMRRRIGGRVSMNKEDSGAELNVTNFTPSSSIKMPESEKQPIAQGEDDEPDPQDLESVSQIKRVLELLRKNRDMLFNEVKLTIAIEDPRDVERRHLLGIDDENAPTRDELAAALVEVNEGKIPKDRVALKMLAEEMMEWPNLEVEITPKKKGPGKSLYAKVTDTGIDPREAAKRLNIDWDTAP